jgi:hypothetical protein
MSDLINSPSHYKVNGIEAIDVIEAFGLGFRLGNVVKYILRADRKGASIADLKKARWYIEREIESRLAELPKPLELPARGDASAEVEPQARIVTIRDRALAAFGAGRTHFWASAYAQDVIGLLAGPMMAPTSMVSARLVQADVAVDLSEDPVSKMWAERYAADVEWLLAQGTSSPRP